MGRGKARERCPLISPCSRVYWRQNEGDQPSGRPGWLVLIIEGKPASSVKHKNSLSNATWSAFGWSFVWRRYGSTAGGRKIISSSLSHVCLCPSLCHQTTSWLAHIPEANTLSNHGCVAQPECPKGAKDEVKRTG